MQFALSRQLFLFLLVGGLQLLVDWAVFVLLTYLGLPLVAGNIGGRVTGALLGFWLNGRYTFAHGGQPRLDGMHLRRFIVAWLLITVLSTGLLSLVEHQFDLRAAWIAKPAVEALMALVGFGVWRQWVYR